jgi:hypothetical protein
MFFTQIPKMKNKIQATTQWIWKKKPYSIYGTLPVAPWDSIGYSYIWMKTIHEEPH